eukprot:TRINITY_DN358_c0_g1_i1.p1 TRINITY_DN358_c0_g1~~TRINITY_DN358_c0_g1_i1.p1  ORF type:complete len:379 (-),score=32.93 TRINITY_DN358_c0_g1_i1:128-1264(-)
MRSSVKHVSPPGLHISYNTNLGVRARMQRAGAIGLLCLFVTLAGCNALTWTIRAGYPSDSIQTVPFGDTGGWSVLQGSSCVDKSTTRWRFVLMGSSLVDFDNADMIGYNASDAAGSLPYRNRLPLFCPTSAPESAPVAVSAPSGAVAPILGGNSGCTSPPPYPPNAFVCDPASNTYLPICASDRCVIDGNIVLNGTTITINQNTTIIGSVNGSAQLGGIKIVISSTGSVPTVNVSDCLASSIPIFVDTSALPAVPQNGTVLEYTSCSGSVAPVDFAGQAWNDCEKGYSRRLNPTMNGDRVLVSLIFTPMDPASCKNELNASISNGVIIGAAVGGAVGLIVIILLVIMVVPSARAKVFPYMSNRPRKNVHTIEMAEQAS